jgi:cellulase/cellobiase CelA1
MINTTGCVGGTATYSIVEAGNATNNMPIQTPLTGKMDESQPGYYSAFVPQLYPRHGDAIVTMNVTCNGVTTPTVINIYIDPSGVVKNTKGEPIDSATVTLYRLNNGVYQAVPNGSTIMAQYNRRNPDTAGEMGTFGWDVQAGTYKVRAEKAGCYKPGTPTQAYIETAALVIPPAVTNLELVLECPASTGGGGNGVNVQLTVNGTDWQNGYCRNLVLTNTTSKAVTWKVNFNLPFPGNITQGWNLNYSKSGNTVTAQGIGWNNVIQPGQTMKDQGFCATK